MKPRGWALVLFHVATLAVIIVLFSHGRPVSFTGSCKEAPRLQPRPRSMLKPLSKSLPSPSQERTKSDERLWPFLAAVCAFIVDIAPMQGLEPVAQAFEDLNPEESVTVDLFQKSTPGVVFVTNEVFKLANTQKMEVEAVPTGTGSGWVFDNEGHIITNYHVIEKASFVTVKFIEGTEVVAKVIGADEYSDVAVLQVDLPAQRKAMLRPLQRGTSAGLRVGQEVYAIGNPFGLDHTLTKGIVSGVGRTIQSVGGRPIQGAIQTDASINPGNSGGPLLNSRGQVIGMNTAIFSPSGASAGIGFAIPSDTVSARVNSILKFGYVKRAGLGLYLGQDGLAQRLSGRPGGVVAGLQKNSAAGEAGVKPGDILEVIDGRRIKTVNDIYAALDEHQPGDVVKVKLLRPDKPDELGLPESDVTFREVPLEITLKEVQKQG